MFHKYINFWLLDKFLCRKDKSGRMIRVLAIHIVSIIWLTLICGKDKNKTFKFNIKVICIFKGKRIGAIQKTFCTLTNQMQSFLVILVYFKYFSDNPGSPFRLIDTLFRLNWGHSIYKYRNSYNLLGWLLAHLRTWYVLHCDWLQLLQCNEILENLEGL